MDLSTATGASGRCMPNGLTGYGVDQATASETTWLMREQRLAQVKINQPVK